jgi:hypothetical protein
MYIQQVKGEFYLVIRRKNYNSLSGRISTRTPDLEAGEVAIKLNVEVPETLFKKPQLQATVVIPQSSVSPPVIDATVLDNVKEILEQQTGLAITLNLVEPTTCPENV